MPLCNSPLLMPASPCGEPDWLRRQGLQKLTGAIPAQLAGCGGDCGRRLEIALNSPHNVQGREVHMR